MPELRIPGPMPCLPRGPQGDEGGLLTFLFTFAPAVFPRSQLQVVYEDSFIETPGIMLKRNYNLRGGRKPLSLNRSSHAVQRALVHTGHCRTRLAPPLPSPRRQATQATAEPGRPPTPLPSLLGTPGVVVSVSAPPAVTLHPFPSSP